MVCVCDVKERKTDRMKRETLLQTKQARPQVEADWSIRMTELEMDNAGDETTRQRRKDKIMASREERLAKIMSMASGRTVDPSEIKVDRTPSPTASEVAAAGVEGKLRTTSSTSLNTESPLPSPSNSKSGYGSRLVHLLVITLSAAIFCYWHCKFASISMVSQLKGGYKDPWKMLLGTFAGVEIAEWRLGRVKGPITFIYDFCLFIWIVLCYSKIIIYI